MKHIEEKEEDHYEYRLDRIFSKSGGLWEHRTFRTVLDPDSYEYKTTTMDQKLDYVRKIIASGENLNRLVREYKMRYYAKERDDIAKAADEALVALLVESMKRQTLNNHTEIQ